MTTPKSHRPWRDRLRDTVDRVDTWINGPDDDDGPWMLEATVTKEWVGYDDAPTLPGVKVTPNVLHEALPPPPPPPAHNCEALDIIREQIAIENLRHEANAWRALAVKPR